MKKWLIMLFIMACLSCSGNELKRDVIIICHQDPYIIYRSVYTGFSNGFNITYKTKSYFIVRPKTNGVLKERYNLIIMERYYYYY